MNKKIEDYLPYYLGCEIMYEYKFTTIDGSEMRLAKMNYMGVNGITHFVDLAPIDKFGNASSTTTFRLNVKEIKPILRPFSSMTDDEAQECLAFVFLVPPHNAWMDVEALQQFLSNNVAFTIGVSEEEQGDIPMNMFELTPQTMFNLTEWLISKHFDIFGLIDAGLAINKTSIK